MAQSIDDFAEKLLFLLGHNPFVMLDVTPREIPSLGGGDERRIELTYSPLVSTLKKPFREYVLLEGETPQQIRERRVSAVAAELSQRGLTATVELNGNYKIVVKKKA